MEASVPSPQVGPCIWLGHVVVVGNTFPEVLIERRAMAVSACGVIVHCEVCSEGSVATALAQCRKVLGDSGATVHELPETQILLPGFIDAHIHAPQYAFTGLGTDRPLMGANGWLETYTFPAERCLANDFARARLTFRLCVRRTLQHGTTTALYFATQSQEVSALLASECAAQGQRAFVGRVAMDRYCPGDYSDTSAVEGAAASAQSLKSISEAYGPLVRGAITPRFVPTCSQDLLAQLGNLAKREPNVVIQSHISESIDEVAFTQAVEEDEAARDTLLLDKHGLLRAPSVMAHGNHLLPEELDVLAARGCAVAHCPLSNSFFAGGHFDVLAAKKKGCQVALGTDVAGGYSPSMLSAMRHAVAASRDLHKSVVEDSLSWRGALWLATAGGAEALGLAATCGRLEVGHAFDALVVDAEPSGVNPSYEARELDSTRTLLSPEALLERFLNLGDDRNIVSIHVAGRLCSPVESKVDAFIGKQSVGEARVRSRTPPPRKDS